MAFIGGLFIGGLAGVIVMALINFNGRDTVDEFGFYDNRKDDKNDK